MAIPQTVRGETMRRLGRALLACLLGICVVCWGTTYKCSLYKSAQEQAKTPVAKLDTRASDIAKVQVESSSQPEADMLLTVVALPMPAAPPSLAVARQNDRPPTLLLLQHSPALFLRPPPAHTLTNI